MASNILAHVAVVWIGICFGAWSVVGRDATRNSADFRPLFLASARNLGGFCLLLLVALLRDRRIRLPRRSEVARVALAGLMDSFIGQLCFLYGLRLTSAMNAASLQPMIPIVASLISCALRIETPTAKQIAGMLIASTGALVVVVAGGPGGSPHKTFAPVDEEHFLVGNILLFVQILCVSSFFLLMRDLSSAPGHDGLWQCVWFLFFGSIGNCAVFAHWLLSHAAGHRQKLGIALLLPERFVVECIFAILVPTVQNYLIQVWAARHVSGSTIALSRCIVPPTALVLSVIFLRESVGWHQVAGICLIVFGLGLNMSSKAGRAGGRPAAAAAAAEGRQQDKSWSGDRESTGEDDDKSHHRRRDVLRYTVEYDDDDRDGHDDDHEDEGRPESPLLKA